MELFFLVVHGALDGMNPLGLLGNFTILVTTDGMDLEFFEFGLLQMVSEPDIRRCGCWIPQGRWIVSSYIG